MSSPPTVAMPSIDRNIFWAALWAITLTSASVLAATPLAATAEAPCGSVMFTQPASTVVRDPRPRIAWQAVAGATAYVLWIESRAPEGRVLYAQESRTAETEWVPSAALTEEAATVKVRVRPLCAADAPVPAQPGARDSTGVFRFRIEPSAACAIAQVPTASWQGGNVTLQWPAAAAATEYEVTIRSAVDGKLHVAQTSVRPQASLAIPPTGIWLASVRPRCGKQAGTRQHLPLSVP